MVGRQSPRKIRIMTAVSAAAISAFAQYAVNRGAHEQRLIEQRLDRDPFRQRLQGDGNDAFNRVDDGDRRSPADLVHRHQDAVHAILAHDVGLRRKTVAHVGHVAHVDGRPIHLLDRQIVQVGDGPGGAVHLHLVLDGADLGRAGRGDDVLRVNCVDHVAGREAVSLQPRHVEIDLHLANLAAIGVGRGRTLHRRQLGAQEILAEIEERLVGQGFTAQTELDDRRGRSGVLDDQRRRRARRQAAQDGLHGRGGLRQCRLDVDLGLKEDLDDAEAVHRLRLNVLDVVDGDGRDALGVADDAVRHLLRREAGEVPQHADDGNVDVGKDVDGSADDGQGHQQDDDQGHDHKRIRAPKR